MSSRCSSTSASTAPSTGSTCDVITTLHDVIVAGNVFCLLITLIMPKASLKVNKRTDQLRIKGYEPKLSHRSSGRRPLGEEMDIEWKLKQKLLLLSVRVDKPFICRWYFGPIFYIFYNTKIRKKSIDIIISKVAIFYTDIINHSNNSIFLSIGFYLVHVFFFLICFSHLCCRWRWMAELVAVKVWPIHVMSAADLFYRWDCQCRCHVHKAGVTSNATHATQWTQLT